MCAECVPPSAAFSRPVSPYRSLTPPAGSHRSGITRERLLELEQILAAAVRRRKRAAQAARRKAERAALQ
jgi:hypothetical protein